MKKLTLMLLAVSAITFAKESYKMIHTEELSQLMNTSPPSLVLLDANNEKTRKENGTIPGAKLLTSYNNFDVSKELPTAKDSKLVFFCANTQCKASHEAANRAIKNGYKDVSVFADGIQGWAKAGKPTTAVN